MDETKTTIKYLGDEVKAMNSNFKKLETDVSIIKTVNNLLIKKSVEIEQQCWANAPYSCPECLKIAGIHTSILQKNLEETFCQIIQALVISVDKNDIDDSHSFREKEQKIG